MNIYPPHSLVYAPEEKPCAFTISSIYSRSNRSNDDENSGDNEELMTIFKICNVNTDDEYKSYDIVQVDSDAAAIVKFHPKVGILEPEASQLVNITMLLDNVFSAKLQIECLAISRKDLHRAKELWHDACATGNLTVKVMEVKHTSFDPAFPKSLDRPSQTEPARDELREKVTNENKCLEKDIYGSKEEEEQSGGDNDVDDKSGYIEECECRDEAPADINDDNFDQHMDRIGDEMGVESLMKQNGGDGDEMYMKLEGGDVDTSIDERERSLRGVENDIKEIIREEKEKGMEEEEEGVGDTNEDNFNNDILPSGTEETPLKVDVATTPFQEQEEERIRQHRLMEELDEVDTNMENRYPVDKDALTPRMIQFKRQQDLLKEWQEDFELSQNRTENTSYPFLSKDTRKQGPSRMDSKVTTPKPTVTTGSSSLGINIELTEDMKMQFYGSPPVSPKSNQLWEGRGISMKIEGNEVHDTPQAVNIVEIADDISEIESTSDFPSINTIDTCVDPSLNDTNGESHHGGHQKHAHVLRRHPKETKTQYKLRSSIYQVDGEPIEMLDGDDDNDVIKSKCVSEAKKETSTFNISYVSYKTAHLTYDDLYRNDSSPVSRKDRRKKVKGVRTPQSRISSDRENDFLKRNDVKTNFEVNLIPNGNILILESVGTAKSIMKILTEMGNQLEKDESPNTVKSIVMQDNEGPVPLPLFLSGIANMEKNGKKFDNTLEEFIIRKTSLVRITKHFNLFKNLMNLDLSSNEITEIVDQLDLPELKYLDLSHNRLKSLDFLQQLTKLEELSVTNNSLASIHQSIHMLVPLRYSLRKVNMSQNTICGDLNYCFEMVSVLPDIEYFDGFNILNVFSGHVRSHVKGGIASLESDDGISQVFENDANPWCDLDESTIFECRLRRVLHHKFRNTSEKDIDNMIRARTPIKEKCDLEDYLQTALESKPEDLDQVIKPNKKPTEEVASYLKATSVSRSKRQSFLVTSRSWSPFKELWTSQDDLSVLMDRSDSPSFMMKTHSSKSKRQSFISREAMDAMKTRLEQTPRVKPLSAATLSYMNNTKSAKRKRASFIEINKERAASAPSRVRQSNTISPIYMSKTKSSATKRKSYLFGSSDSIDFSTPVSSSRSPGKQRKSFIEVNIEQCSNSSKIRAMKKYEENRRKAANFRLNENVEVMFEGREKLYAGRISKTHLDGHFDIKYDDGDEEFYVPAKYIYKLSSAHRGKSIYRSSYQRVSSPVNQGSKYSSSPTKKSNSNGNDVFSRLLNTPTSSSRPKRLSYVSPVRHGHNEVGFVGTGYLDVEGNDSVLQRTMSPTQPSPSHLERDKRNDNFEHLRNRLLSAAVKVYGNDLNRFFRDVDIDHNGFVDMDELRFHIKKLLPAIQEKKVDAFLKKAREQSTNSEGLDSDEFEDFIDYQNCLHRNNTSLLPSFTPFSERLRNIVSSLLKEEGNINHVPFSSPYDVDNRRVVRESSLISLFPNVDEPSNLSMLVAMGYDENEAEVALRKSSDVLEKAIVLLTESPKVLLKTNINQVERRDTPQRLKTLEHRPSLCSPKPVMLGIESSRQ